MILKNFCTIFIILGLTTGTMVGIRNIQKKYSPHPEWCRKLMHMGSGIIALTFPFIFKDAWPVITLCVLSAGGLFALKSLPILKQKLGSVLGGVKRNSSGDIYFAAAIGFLFFLSGENLLLYYVPVLILTFADAAAALIGISYGRSHFKISAGKKSIEGSTAFFLVAFFCTHIPLLLFSNTGRAEILIISFLLSLLLMIIEAVTVWDGLDNFLIPLLGFVFLNDMLDSSLIKLAIQASTMTAILALIFFFQFRTPFISLKLVNGLILGYLCWLFRAWRWILAPLIQFMTAH